ncbi:MAG TPA: TonB-dependent receptor [Blastocatellia bacterium]|nr:TonB-dependent receptor [Blastocatellia bacterium]
MLFSKRAHLSLGLAALTAILFAGAAFGQVSSTGGAIGGTVLDQSGAVISGATVTAKNIDTGQDRTTKTGEAGQFRFPLLQVGRYEIAVDATGFGQFKQIGLSLLVGDDLNVSVVMKPSTTTEVMNITAEAPIADPEKTQVATTVGQQAIKDLPINGRRWSQFVLLTPGVSMDGSFGLISFRGISGLLNNNTIDGSDNNQAFFSEERGRTRINYVISQDSIKEFQVNTQNYSAEFGRAAGGVTNAVTKSGTNEFHGSGFYYVRDVSMNARNPLSFITTGITSTGAPIRAAINPDDRRQQFGGTFGGPIIKDKLFFFFNYDQQKRNFPVNAQPGSPLFLSSCTAPATAAQCSNALNFILPQTGLSPRQGNQWIFFPKVDWQINPNHQFSASYNYLNWNSPNGIQTQPIVNFTDSANGPDRVRADILNLRLVSTLGGSKLNEARFQFGRDFEFEPSNDPNGVGLAIASSSGLNIGPPNFLPRAKYPDEKKLEAIDNFSVYHGAHAIKFGADLMRTSDAVDNLFLGRGLYTYATLSSFAVDLSTAGSKTYSRYQQAFGPSAIQFHTYDISGFVTDEYKARPNITLNFGLRYEHEVLPHTILGNPLAPHTQTLPSDGTDFGPRVGVAWDIRNNHKTVVRAGYGIYYGRIINSSIDNALLNTGEPGSVQSITFFPSSGPSYPGRFNALPTGTATPKASLFWFAPNLRLPMIHEADASIEREITPSMSVSASYLMSRGRRLPFFFDQNLAPSNKQQQFQVKDATGSVVQTITLPVFTSPRPNAAFNSEIEEQSAVSSTYDAFVLQFNKRFSHGVQFMANFTYSRSLDTDQTSQTFSSAFPTAFNQFDINADRGRSNFDTPRRFVASGIWELPFWKKSDNTFVRTAIAGWLVSGIVTVQDGFRVPESVNIVSTIPGATAFSENGSGGTFIVPFEPRNNFQLPALENFDLRLAKRFQFRERYGIEFLAEAFNLFNHTLVFAATNNQYDLNGSAAIPVFTPRKDFLTPTSDQSTLYRERQLQLSARFTF